MKHDHHLKHLARALVLLAFLGLTTGCSVLFSTWESEPPPPAPPPVEKTDIDDPFVTTRPPVLFDRLGKDREAMLLLEEADFTKRRDREAFAAALQQTSQGFRAAVALPLLRRAFSLDDPGDGRRLAESVCQAIGAGLDHALARKARLDQVQGFCAGRVPGPLVKDASAREAGQLLRLWRRGDFDGMQEGLKRLAGTLSQQAAPAPRRMPYNATRKWPLMAGIALQVAGFDDLVVFGATEPDPVDDTRRAYSNLYEENQS